MKVEASIAIATFDELNEYFKMSEMPIASNRYWNMVNKKDLAGLLIQGKSIIKIFD